jgi:hypothetical protein
MPYLRILGTGLSPQWPRFSPMPIHVGFVLAKVALEHIFPPEYFHTYSIIYIKGYIFFAIGNIIK